MNCKFKLLDREILILFRPRLSIKSDHKTKIFIKQPTKDTMKLFEKKNINWKTLLPNDHQTDSVVEGEEREEEGKGNRIIFEPLIDLFIATSAPDTKLRFLNTNEVRKIVRTIFNSEKEILPFVFGHVNLKHTEEGTLKERVADPGSSFTSWSLKFLRNVLLGFTACGTNSIQTFFSF